LRDRELTGVPGELRYANGAPQFYPRSGVCWFCAMCWTSTANEHMWDLIHLLPPALGRVQIVVRHYMLISINKERKMIYMSRRQPHKNAINPMNLN
jgi:hypothetical protein